jgi:hypothetical protein
MVFGLPSTEEERSGTEKASRVELRHGFSTSTTKLVEEVTSVKVGFLLLSSGILIVLAIVIE